MTSPSFENVLVLTSPKAGSGANRDQIPQLVDLLDRSGIGAKITHDPADLARLGQSCPPATVVVAAGGDGTITLAASKLIADPTLGDTPQVRIPIVAMPLGTENLLARHFGYRANARAVLQTIQQGTLHHIDMAVVKRLRSDCSITSQTWPMLTMATSGFDAEVVRSLHLRRKGHIRRTSYLRPIGRAMARYRFPPLQMETLTPDGDVTHVIDCGWAMVFNLPCYAAGLAIEPDAIGDDGLLDIVAFHGQSVGSGLRYLASLKIGRPLKHPDVTRVRVNTVRIRSRSRVHFQIDGDYVGRLPIEITTRPGAVTLLLPPTL